MVVERLAPVEQLDRIEAELEPYLRATAPGGDEFTGHNTRRTGALLARSPSFRDLAAHPLVLGALDRVLGDHATSYQLHLTQVIEIGPGEPAQLVHRDQWAFDFFPFPAGFEVECHTMWAMNDFTEENGATRVIPGSNHWEDKLRPTNDETVPAEMPKGSVLLYLGSLYHGGGANRSARAATRHQRRLHAFVVAAGGEPVPRVPAGSRARAARAVGAARGLPTRCVRARLLRRPPRPDRSAARRVGRGAELLAHAVSAEPREPLRLGLVGCGSIAQAHAAALRFLTDDGLVRVDRRGRSRPRPASSASCRSSARSSTPAPTASR